MPEWLLELIRKAPEPERPTIVPSDPTAITDRRVRGLLGSLLGKVRGASDGLKHTTLLAVARTIGGYFWLLPYGEDQLVGLLLDALPATVEDWNKAARTARDGLRHGAQTPLDFEERRPPPWVKANGGPAPASPQAGQKADQSQGKEEGEPEPEPEEDAAVGPGNGQFGADQPAPEADPLRGDILPPELHGCPLTEDGVAQAFAIERGNELRFCHGPNRWHVWDGTRWRVEPTKLAYGWVRELARRMARGTASSHTRATLGKAAFAAGVERLAQSDRAFAVTADLFDRDPWLLGTPGGTVDLRTGELRAASLQDYISKQTRVTPAEPGTRHPLWTQFLKEFTNGDREYRRFIQQVCGYCLTGDVREECLFFFFGPGQTGKGTLLRTVANIAGDYATASGMETFTISKFSRHPTELAKLAGARMVTATETERGRTWAWARIKYLTGNEGRGQRAFHATGRFRA